MLSVDFLASSSAAVREVGATGDGGEVELKITSASSLNILRLIDRTTSSTHVSQYLMDCSFSVLDLVLSRKCVPLRSTSNARPDASLPRSEINQFLPASFIQKNSHSN